MLILSFEGWFQARLATDPDPCDDPRGVSGPTFAAPGEPDFDRIIRLQDPVAPRYPLGQQVGVTVRAVTVGGQPAPADHPLLGAKVELLGGAKFEGRNFAIAGTGREPIDPFIFQISGGGVTLQRQDFWDPQHPDRGILDITPDVMARRQPDFRIQSPEVAEATGMMDYVGYRKARLAQLQQRLPGEQDPIARAALEKRIDALKKDDEGMAGITGAILVTMGVQETFSFEINGPAPIVTDPTNRLRGTVGTSQYWPITFWMGGFDTDTLCAYLRGSLSVPFLPDPPAG